MHCSFISSIFALVFGVAGCSLLLFYLLSKNQTYRSAAWLSLGLGCAAVFSSVTTLVTQYSLTLNNCTENQGLVAASEAIVPRKDTFATFSSDADLEMKEFKNGYRSPDRQQKNTIRYQGRLVLVPRKYWVASAPKSTTPLAHPVEYVVISQTATEPCFSQVECTLTVRYLQVFHVEGKKWLDIAYNFLVAGDGQAYEGRGWDVVGAHTIAEFNGISIGISFVGTFSDSLPPPVQIRACKLLIEEGVRMGKISPNYKLVADRQLSQTENPGKKFYEELQTWDHWTSDV